MLPDSGDRLRKVHGVLRGTNELLREMNGPLARQDHPSNLQWQRAIPPRERPILQEQPPIPRRHAPIPPAQRFIRRAQRFNCSAQRLPKLPYIARMPFRLKNSRLRGIENVRIAGWRTELSRLCRGLRWGTEKASKDLSGVKVLRPG